MAILYGIRNNNLTKESNDCRAQVKTRGSAGLDEIAQRIVDQGSTVTLEDARAVLTGLTKAVLSILLEGRRVNLVGVADLYPRIRGHFTGISDEYSHRRHVLGVNASVSRKLLKQFRTLARLEKTSYSEPEPLPQAFTDLGAPDKPIDLTYTPGCLGKIYGARLNYNPEAPDEGIFFISQSTGEIVKVTQPPLIEPRALTFIIPEVDGPQRIEVRARLRGGKELRTGHIGAVLQRAVL